MKAGRTTRFDPPPFGRLAELEPDTAVDQFVPLINNSHNSSIYLAALESVSRLDVDAAAVAGLKLIAQLDDGNLIWTAFSVQL